MKRIQEKPGNYAPFKLWKIDNPWKIDPHEIIPQPN